MSTKQQREIDHSVYKQDLKRREVKVRLSSVTVQLDKTHYTISNAYTLSAHFQTLSTHYLTYTHCLLTIYALSTLLSTLSTHFAHYLHQIDEEEGLFMCYTDPSRNISVGDTKAEMEVMARNQAGVAGASHVTCHEVVTCHESRVTRCR